MLLQRCRFAAAGAAVIPVEEDNRRGSKSTSSIQHRLEVEMTAEANVRRVFIDGSAALREPRQILMRRMHAQAPASLAQFKTN
jgi:hypothetical protein